jgi:hypothetical protein
LVALLFGTYVRERKRHQRLRDAMRVAATELGLPMFETKEHARIRGQLAGFEVEVLSRLSAEPFDVAAMTIRGASIPHSLSIGAEESWTLLGPLVHGERVYTCDAEFDRFVRVQGDDVQAAALLDEKTRQLILRMVRGVGVSVFFGRVYVELSGAMRSSDDGMRIVETLRGMLEVARALSIQGPSISERLERNAAEDDVLTVRHRNLVMLLVAFPDVPASERALSSALVDPEPAIRVIAAMHAGERGFEPLEDIAVDENVADELRGRAIMHLAKSHPRDRVIPVLERALESRSLPVCVQAAAAMASLEHHPESQRRRLLAMLDSGEVHAIRAVVRLIQRAGDTHIEDLLIALLRRELRIAHLAVETLARIGTARSVEPLLELAERTWLDSTLENAALAAVERIQARLVGKERGALSLASSALDGALSVPSSEGGLSLSTARKKDP